MPQPVQIGGPLKEAHFFPGGNACSSLRSLPERAH